MSLIAEHKQISSYVLIIEERKKSSFFFQALAMRFIRIVLERNKMRLPLFVVFFFVITALYVFTKTMKSNTSYYNDPDQCGIAVTGEGMCLKRRRV